MKKTLFFLLFIVTSFFSKTVYGQIYYGYAVADSFSFSFGAADSLHHSGYFDPIFIDTTHTDTTNTYLWQIGNTHKPFFADTNGTNGIMTDTQNVYPVNANSWFVMGFFEISNVIISFRHKYQTTLGHDGGIVEFSVDNGQTWQNIIGDCSTQGQIFVDNFYGINDTLASGEPAFTGTDTSWVNSKIQFVAPLPIKPNGSWCNLNGPIEIRFRFKSDSTADTLAGWIIGRINIEQDYYHDGIAKLNKPASLNVYPNPSTDAIYNFPALDGEKDYSIEVLNAMGSRVISMPYKRQLDLSAYPAGLYFYRVTNGDVNYSGKLLRE